MSEFEKTMSLGELRIAEESLRKEMVGYLLTPDTMPQYENAKVRLQTLLEEIQIREEEDLLDDLELDF